MWLKKIFVCIYLCYITAIFATPTFTNSAPLKVGVVLQMPFAQNINGHYSGIAIDIWANIAKSNHWDYTYIPLANRTDAELKRRLIDNGLDIIIGPMSVNSHDLQSVDFTRPFFISSIVVITKKHGFNIYNVLQTFLSRSLLIYIAILIISFSIFIMLLWRIEKGKLSQVFTHYYNALTTGIWFHVFRKGMSVPKTFFARLMLTPTAVYSRLITIFWLIIAALIFTTINASYIASMTFNLNQSESGITTIRDLEAVSVAGVSGQKNVEITEINGIYVHKVKTFDMAIQLLHHSKVDAVVCDVPEGIEYLRQHKAYNLQINPLVIQNDELAFAVQLNSPIKHQIDLGITRLQDNGQALEICRTYIGTYATRCDL